MCPAQIRIGPYNVSIRFSLERIVRVTGWMSEMPSRGMYERDEHLITVDPNMPLEQQVVTLWHEIMHAIYQITMHPHNGTVKDSGDRYDEETVIHGLAPLQIAVLQDNPELVRFLLSPMEGSRGS